MPLPTTKQKFPPNKKWPLLFKKDKGELLSLHSCSKEINIIPVLTLNNLLFYPVVAISLFHCWPGRHLDHLDDDAISSLLIVHRLRLPGPCSCQYQLIITCQ